MTLFAQWSPMNYTVTFNANGGIGAMPNQLASAPAVLNANVFAYSGHTFTGWNSSANGSGSSYVDGGSYAFSSSITLYAQWVANSYSVTFSPNGGAGSMANQSSNVPNYLTANSYTNSGYLFTGWSTQANGSGTGYSNEGYYAFTSSITLYAQWALAHTVIFNANGGSGNMASQVGDSLAPLTGNTYTLSGYAFVGWNTQAGGGGTSYGNGAAYAFTSSITLYAQWALAYTVTFNANNGTGSTSSQTSGGAINLNANLFTYSGYAFTGWNTQANGSGTSYADGATYAFTSSITLYAQWVVVPATSTNWSGYVLTGAPGGYQVASGSWVVPSLNCSVTPNSAVSTFVGVNGSSSYPSGLFQTGTTTLCTNGVESAYAWWTDEQMNYVGLDLYAVSPGNHINAAVYQNSGGTWSYSISDTSNAQSSTSAESFSGSGLSAEWIVEDPGTGGGLYILGDFTSITFTNMSLTSPATGFTLPAGAQQLDLVSLGGLLEDTAGSVTGASFTVTQVGT
jgi:hypothetical protein